METSKNICATHKQPIQAICVYINCKSRQVCIKCIAKNHKECGPNFVFLCDLNNSDISSVFDIELISSIIPTKTAVQAMDTNSGFEYNDQIASTFSVFIDEINTVISKYESEVTDLFSNARQIEGFKENVMRILKIDELTALISNYSSKRELDLGLNEIELIKNQPEVLQKLKEYISSLKEQLSYPKAISELSKQLESTKLIFAKTLNTESLFMPETMLDTNMKSYYHEINSSKTSLKHVGGDYCTCVTFLNFEMKPYTGVYTWKMSFEGLGSTEGSISNYWGAPGVLDEGNYQINRDSASWSVIMCVGTDNYCYGGMTITHNQISGQFTGKVLECQFDTNTAVFTVTSGTVLKASGQGKLGFAYKPVVATYRDGNICHLVE